MEITGRMMVYGEADCLMNTDGIYPSLDFSLPNDRRASPLLDIFLATRFLVLVHSCAFSPVLQRYMGKAAPKKRLGWQQFLVISYRGDRLVGGNFHDHVTNRDTR